MKHEAYVSPSVEMLALAVEDILTFSAGFDGEEHPFELPNE